MESHSQLSKAPVAIFAAAPKGQRAKRAKWAIKPSQNESVIAYCAHKNVVLRDLNNATNTKIINQGMLVNLACAAFSPNGDLVAMGDVNGLLVIGKFEENGEFKRVLEKPAI